MEGEGDAGEVVFETSAPVLFSPLEKKLGISLQWKPWKIRFLILRGDGTLEYRKEQGENAGLLDLRRVEITEMTNNTREEGQGEAEQGLVVRCRKMDGFETHFRCILAEAELSQFKDAVRLTAQEHNVDCLRRNSITGQVRLGDRGPRLQPWHRGGGVRGGNLGKQSAMRRAVARAMDRFDVRSVRQRTISRRGAMKCLPVFFSSDLVQGSWWLVVGSVLFVATSVVVLLNSYDDYLLLGDDDSALNRYHYRATWVLMIASGVFGTLGSMAFMRAVHSDPPMRPLFSVRHLQSDELLGSWLFLLAGLPVVPYSLIYVGSEQGSLVYLGSLLVSVLLVLGSLLFVYACYPSDKPRRRLIQPLAYLSCVCFCSREWMSLHLCNDWLAGCWFTFWGSLLATFGCLVYFLGAAARRDSLQTFLYGTALVETLFFLMGSAYFVAGSYPEGALLAAQGAQEGEGGGETEAEEREAEAHLLGDALEEGEGEGEGGPDAADFSARAWAAVGRGGTTVGTSRGSVYRPPVPDPKGGGDGGRDGGEGGGDGGKGGSGEGANPLLAGHLAL